MNPNYDAVIKQALDKLLDASFIAQVEEVSWLLLIVIVTKKNGKFKICLDFWQLNVVTKKDPYLVPFTKKVLNEMIGHEVYSFLDGFF
jgi:hypothetical protein